jgi:thioredoxin 1
MIDELEEIKRRKLEQLKTKYMKGDKKMKENYPEVPIKITDADIEENIKKYPLMVVDCWAPWCGPCRMIGPIIEELAKEKTGRIVFAKLNVDENRGTSMKYGIMSIPSLLVFKNGNLVDNIIGAMPKEMLKAKIAPYE